MPTLSPRPVHLNEAERKELQQLANRHTTPQQIAHRARIILLASQGKNHHQIARELNISRDMARTWRERWLKSREREVPIEKRLQDAQRSGAPLTFSAEQVIQLFAIACENPAESGRKAREAGFWVIAGQTPEDINTVCIYCCCPHN